LGFFWFCFVLFFCSAVMEPRATHMLGRHSVLSRTPPQCVNLAHNHSCIKCYPVLGHKLCPSLSTILHWSNSHVPVFQKLETSVSLLSKAARASGASMSTAFAWWYWKDPVWVGHLTHTLCYLQGRQTLHVACSQDPAWFWP
jgi:hypothetical protein